jgi:hypothetical protein
VTDRDATRVYRSLFALAAAYHLALGLWAGLEPGSFFTVFALAPAPSLALWVVLFGLLYALVAWAPEQGDLVVAAALLTKVVIPLAWLTAVGRGEGATQTFLLVLANDLVWWFPFLFYLLRRSSARRAVIAWVGVVVHVLACLGLMVSRGGTEMVADPAERARWVAEHVPLWAATWLVWALASISLLAFTTVWVARLLELGVPRRWALLGWLIVAVGLCFDLVGESLNLIWPTQPGRTVASFAWGARLYGILSAGTANGLYCVGGLLLSWLSWRAGWLRGGVGLLGVAMWLVGLALTVMVVLDHGPGMIVTGAGVMALFVPWEALVGWRFLREGSSARTIV